MIKQTEPNKFLIFSRVHLQAWRGFGFLSITLTVFLLSTLLKISLIVPLFLVVLVFYLKLSNPQLENKTYNLLNFSFLFVIIFVISYTVINRHLSVFYIPFSLIPMLAIILFDNLSVTLLLVLAIATAIAAVARNNYLLGVFFLVSGILTTLLAKGVRRRSAIIRTGMIIGVAQVICLFSVQRFKIYSPASYIILFLNGITSSLLVTGLLPIFEYLFKTVTNISLLEMADLNNPLLQRMIIEAPGTYHHSLIVGNLSDVASKAIGANALLARIGAYYHDIGKLNKPDYFSENQAENGNKHASLAPGMSKLIIMNHVKEGVELAKKHNLNPAIINFIEQHHGNSLVYYFYRRALENLEVNQEVEEDGFRYPGPKPKTKEVAIVLLSDSVEAAARALREPNPQKIEELVHKIINNKFIDGQLDECDLTLKDIEKISAVFIRILTGIYHGRITYPEKSSS